MNLANEIIKEWPEPGIIQARPVIRHGEKPHLINCNSLKEIATTIKKIVRQLKVQDYKSIAIICKTLDECNKVHRHLAKEAKLNTTILTGTEDNYQGGLVILPAYLAKGLEFDAVFIVGLESAYTQSELDIKLLYVAMTRAHHRLYILQKDRTIDLLDDVKQEFYQCN